jgi:hypothetical protein
MYSLLRLRMVIPALTFSTATTIEACFAMKRVDKGRDVYVDFSGMNPRGYSKEILEQEIFNPSDRFRTIWRPIYRFESVGVPEIGVWRRRWW